MEEREGWEGWEECERNNFTNYASQLQAAFAQSSKQISNPKSIKIARYSFNFCDSRSNKSDPNLCACLGKLIRPRSYLTLH